MNTKTKNLIAAGVIAAAAATGAVAAYHFYQESRKSGLEKAAGKTVDWTDNAVDQTAKATRDAAKWTDKTATKTADKTKKLFK